jgi:hypothetical protein
MKLAFNKFLMEFQQALQLFYKNGHENKVVISGSQKYWTLLK